MTRTCYRRTSDPCAFVVAAFLRIGIDDRERNPLPALVNPHDDKLPGLLFFRDPRRRDLELLDVRREKSALDYSEQGAVASLS